MSTLEERLVAVRERIARALAQAGREPHTVTLVAVSKTVSVEAIRSAYAAGQRDFGENYVQEFVAKRAALADLVDLRWHLIGHVQRNKVRFVADAASMIHSLHSAALVEELARRRRSVAEAAPLPVLIEVNVGREAQKSGCLPEQAEHIAATIDAQPNLKLCGLMTVPPHTETPEGARPYFDALLALRTELGGPKRLPELSMGMSFDLEPAILAGATLVRVGTLLFGPRG